MKYLYDTNFKLNAEVNDFDEASNYLTEDDMTVYLKDDNDIPISVREAVVHIEWELIGNDYGKVHLTTTRKLDEKELEYISDCVKGQNSDGLGEGFEQQDFADHYDEDAYFSDHDWWEEKYQDACDDYNSMDDEEKEEWGSEDKYATHRAGYEPWERSEEYHTMCSFDWDTNDYIFVFVEEIEE